MQLFSVLISNQNKKGQKKMHGKAVVGGIKRVIVLSEEKSGSQ